MSASDGCGHDRTADFLEARNPVSTIPHTAVKSAHPFTTAMTTCAVRSEWLPATYHNTATVELTRGGYPPWVKRPTLRKLVNARL